MGILWPDKRVPIVDVLATDSVFFPTRQGPAVLLDFQLLRSGTNQNQKGFCLFLVICFFFWTTTVF